jgi:hypothetical protein
MNRSSIHAYATDCSTFKTYFICRFPDNKTELFDCVKAIADGALTLVTNKVSNPEKHVCWSKQRACFLFEVFHLML